MAKKTSSPTSSAVAFPDEDHDVLVFEDADEFMTQQSSQPMEDVQAKVHEAQAELMHLRQRQEEIEKQKGFQSSAPKAVSGTLAEIRKMVGEGKL